MAKKLSCAGRWSWWNFSAYSKYFTTRNTSASTMVAAIHSLNLGRLPILQEAQDTTMVMELVITTAVLQEPGDRSMVMELVISSAVLKVPSGTLRISLESWSVPGGQCGAPVRIST